MSRLVLFSFLFLFLNGCGQGEKDSGEIGVQLTPAVLDFGRVRAESGPIELSFCIKNKGARPLTIEKILPSCGCTLCDLPSDTIPPMILLQQVFMFF